VQTIRVAHAHEQADDDRWRLDTAAQRVDRQIRRHDVAEIGTSTHLPVLDEPHEREAVGHELEVTLHELVDLSLIGKQLHWAVVGPLFRPLHLHLDELVDSWRELADTVAERAVALGHVPDGQAQAVAAGSPLTPVVQGPVEDHAVVWELVQRITKVSELVRARMDRLGEIDLASQDVLIEVVRALEEQQWMLRVQLTGRS
jgi:starvation-inducible DNA-binding protein